MTLQDFIGCPHDFHFCGLNMAKNVHITRHKGRQLLITWDNFEIVNKITGMPETLVNSVNLNMLQYYQIQKVLTGTYSCLPVIQHGRFLMYVPVCKQQCPKFTNSSHVPRPRDTNKRSTMYPQLSDSLII